MWGLKAGMSGVGTGTVSLSFHLWADRIKVMAGLRRFASRDEDFNRCVLMNEKFLLTLNRGGT